MLRLCSVLWIASLYLIYMQDITNERIACSAKKKASSHSESCLYVVFPRPGFMSHVIFHKHDNMGSIPQEKYIASSYFHLLSHAQIQ